MKSTAEVPIPPQMVFWRNKLQTLKFGDPEQITARQELALWRLSACYQCRGKGTRGQAAVECSDCKGTGKQYTYHPKKTPKP